MQKITNWNEITTEEAYRLSQAELKSAYFAGFFDGEGSITIHRNVTDKRLKSGKVNNYSLKIHVGNTNKQVILDFATWANNGSFYKVNMSNYKNGKGLVMYYWETSSDKAILILEKILPYLRIKKAEAEVAIEFRKKHKEIIKQRISRKPYTPEQIGVFDNYRYQLSQLKTNRASQGRIYAQ